MKVTIFSVSSRSLPYKSNFLHKRRGTLPFPDPTFIKIVYVLKSIAGHLLWGIWYPLKSYELHASQKVQIKNHKLNFNEPENYNRKKPKIKPTKPKFKKNHLHLLQSNRGKTNILKYFIQSGVFKLTIRESGLHNALGRHDTWYHKC